jgi:hypothetical protein
MAKRKASIESVTKVTLEVTAERYTLTCWDGEKKVSTRTSVMYNPGHSRDLKKGDVEKFLDELQDLMMAGFGVAGRLWENAELRGEAPKRRRVDDD